MSSTTDIPQDTWRRRFDAKDPSDRIHTYSRPPALEALSLLPVAYRVGSYIQHELAHDKEPIFDLRGITLAPPNPGPHAGVPLGGVGGGSIGRGFRGDFRRWSIHPGRYIHQNIPTDCFVLRIQRGKEIFSKVLSTLPPNSKGDEKSTFCVNCWDWSLSPHCAEYHALFPYAWTVFDNPIPHCKVTLKQISPFLPHSYSEASLPVGVFEVDVEDTHPQKSTQSDIQVSIMFVFQNGYETHDYDDVNQCYHYKFQGEKGVEEGKEGDGSESKSASATATEDVSITGIEMTSRKTKTYHEHDESTSMTSSSTFAFMQCVENSLHRSHKVTDEGSYAIATSVPSQATSTKVSYCPKFISKAPKRNTQPLFGFCEKDEKKEEDDEEMDLTESARNLWHAFHSQGHIDDMTQYLPSQLPLQCEVAAAICVSQVCSVKTKHRVGFKFALAWDFPLARFGSGHALPKYYSRFFGKSGTSASNLACYALQHVDDWQARINAWQGETLAKMEAAHEGSGSTDDDRKKHTTTPSTSSKASNRQDRAYYKHMIFNELYYLVDGGTFWLDSTAGESNQLDAVQSQESVMIRHDQHVSFTTPTTNTSSSSSANASANQSNIATHKAVASTTYSTLIEMEETHFQEVTTTHSQDGSIDPLISTGQDSPLGKKMEQGLTAEFKVVALDKLNELRTRMLQHDHKAQQCGGNQRMIGQFLYLEGHEYLMYNTYDVHFYASYALIMLWPQLELSLQRDIAKAVHVEDLRTRRMMGEGHICERKVKGVVPHDVGSPSETPFHVLNAYNFQDVSRWKDLGPKFILQVYRDYIFLLRQDGNKKDNKHQGKTFVQDLYPILVHVMDYMMSFDLDHDGMIENSGFPDQTYDIWIAKGIHAYCGGLWISACEAIAAIAKDIMQDVLVHEKYQSIARKGREVYIRTLYNGTYLNYDSSTSDHSKSIMADMLAGQWYAHCCQLPAVLPADQALSCLRTIYANNVIKFGKGEFIGAVNGMLPNGQVDVSCLQSREVWTGTTYALASVMMYEGLRSNSKTDREELLSMAFNTARGIHDGGWQKFGYWFATPEGWESNGNYRSLGYMRALCIWSMQYAVHDCEPRTSSHP